MYNILNLFSFYYFAKLWLTTSVSLASYSVWRMHFGPPLLGLLPWEKSFPFSFQPDLPPFVGGQKCICNNRITVPLMLIYRNFVLLLLRYEQVIGHWISSRGDLFLVEILFLCMHRCFWIWAVALQMHLGTMLAISGFGRGWVKKSWLFSGIMKAGWRNYLHTSPSVLTFLWLPVLTFFGRRLLTSFLTPSEACFNKS